MAEANTKLPVTQEKKSEDSPCHAIAAPRISFGNSSPFFQSFPRWCGR